MTYVRSQTQRVACCPLAMPSAKPVATVRNTPPRKLCRPLLVKKVRGLASFKDKRANFTSTAPSLRIALFCRSKRSAST